MATRSPFQMMLDHRARSVDLDAFDLVRNHRTLLSAGTSGIDQRVEVPAAGVQLHAYFADLVTGVIANLA